MSVGDHSVSKTLRLRLHEKGGKPHEVPSHPNLEVHLNGWTRATGTGAEKKKLLFLSVHKGDDLTGNAMSRFAIFQLIKRRSDGAGLPYSHLLPHVSSHRHYDVLLNGGALERSQTIANHENRSERPSSMIAVEKNYRSKWWKRSKSEVSETESVALKARAANGQ
jgi:integrase